MNEPRKCVIVPRVSTEAQAEDGTSLESQELACLRKAAEIGSPVHAVYRDEGVSGALYHTRPGIQNALNDLEEGRAQCLITYKLDRAGRDVDILRDIRKRVHRAGGEMIFADGMQFANNPQGNLMFTQMAGWAEYEKDQIRERTMGGRKNKALGIHKDGGPATQPCRAMRPYGYHIVTKADVITVRYPADMLGQYIVIDHEARWVSEGFARYDGGQSLRNVCRWLTDAGASTPRKGEFWRPSTLKRILSNPVYKGMAVFGRHERITDERRVLDGYKVPYSIRPTSPDKWVYIPAPAIVDTDVWDRCNARLAEAREVFGGNPERKHKLSGLLRCPACERGMGGDNGGRKGGRKGRPGHTYHCTDARPSRNIGRKVCTPVYYDGAKTEQIIIQGFLRAASDPTMLKAALMAWTDKQRRRAPADDTERLEKELKAVERREQATVKAQIAGVSAGADPSVYKSEFEEIARLKKDLSARLKCAKNAQKGTDPEVIHSACEIQALALEKLTTVLTSPKATPSEQHDILAGIVKGIWPEDERGERFRIELRPFVKAASGETVANVSIIATVSAVQIIVMDATEGLKAA